MDKLKLVPLKDIGIRDSFWDRYISLVHKVLIPYQWDILNDNLEEVETSHCIKNFKIAAEWEEGTFYGAVFQDSDLAKWLEAVAYSLAVHPDKELENTADAMIELIAAAQREDGYINTYFIIKGLDLRFTNMEEGHELYCAGHLMEAAVAYYKATGKDSFVQIMKRFADLICDEFSEAKNAKGYPGHQEVEIGLYKLFEVTGERKYLEQARSFLERRGAKPNYFLEVYIMWTRGFGLRDSYLPLILPYLCGGGAFNIFLIRQFIMTIPKELDEAATIDGAGRFRILFSIIIPAIKSAMIVVALFIFISLWNDLLQQMIYINSSEKYTIALGLTNFKGQLKQDWSLTMSATCLSFAPGVIFYLIGQKYFVEGITMTGMKN
ncbi:MAG: hypothetical protein K0R05_3720 [Anaerocolumna sp.]|jgi:hypothetical protein|nr:hypothetical protein [Anaerocolumna sp.]